MHHWDVRWIMTLIGTLLNTLVLMSYFLLLYPPHNKVVGGILVSLRPSVCSTSCVRSVAPTVLDPFHIHTSYQATSEGVSHVKVLAKFENFNFWQFLKICNFDFVFFIPPPNKVGGGVYWIHLVRPSVRPSVCPSVRPSVRLSVDDMVSGA